jgi:ribosomal protein S6
VVLQAKAEPVAMDELHRSLSLSDDVIRHKILRIPEAVYGKLGGTPETNSATSTEPDDTEDDE